MGQVDDEKACFRQRWPNNDFAKKKKKKLYLKKSKTVKIHYLNLLLLLLLFCGILYFN